MAKCDGGGGIHDRDTRCTISGGGGVRRTYDPCSPLMRINYNRLLCVVTLYVRVHGRKYACANPRGTGLGGFRLPHEQRCTRGWDLKYIAVRNAT